MDQYAVLEQVVAWARRHDNIRVLVLTGSVARGGDAFDRLSDLDIEIYVRHTSALLDETSWYEQFGDVVVVEALENPGWHPTRLVYYADGKIDFMVAPTTALADGVAYAHPFQLLVDKDDAHAAFRMRAGAHASQPTPRDFFENVRSFHAATIMWAKALARDDPWSANIRDSDTKKLMFQMLEWDHKARYGWEYETWSSGVRLRAWADRELVSSLEKCWSPVATNESAEALLASMRLFETLSLRTARALGLQPFDATRVRAVVERLLRLRSSGRAPTA